jgi:hypothetical protein
MRAVRQFDEKLVLASDGDVRLYDLARDPGERSDLAASRPDRVAALSATLAELVERYGEPGTAASTPETPLDPAIEEHLRSLGYVK